MTGSPAPSVVIAEDNVLLREGLASVVERFGLGTAIRVGDAEELLRAVAADRPALVVTDVRMPPTFRDEGLCAALALRADDPALPVVVLSQYVEHTYARELLAGGGGGGIGYLLKERVGDVRSLVAALREVLDGGTVIDPEVVRRLLDRRRDPLSRLSDRERETLGLMAQGRSNAAIARELDVAEATVAKHIRSLLGKLGLPPSPDSHRRVLAVVAYLQGD